MQKLKIIDINIIFVITLSILYFILFIFWPDSYGLTNSEYGFVETVTALLYLITFLICINGLIRKKSKNNKLIFLFLLFSLLCFLEETNWLQNYINYSIESIQSQNSQNSVNIHNLEIFQGGSLLNSKLSFSIFLKSQNLFRIFFSTYFIFLPLVYRLSLNIRKSLDKINYFNPNNNFLFTLILNLIVNLFLLILIQKNQFEYEYAKSLAESRELIYSMYIFSYTFYLTDLKIFTFKKLFKRN